MLTENMTGMLRTICSSLQGVVVFLLLVLIAASLMLLGSLIVEIFTERRHLKVSLPELVDELWENEDRLAECIEGSGLLKRQKKALIEITKHEEITDIMREALAVRLLESEKAHFDKIVKLSDTVAKLGPMFGLLGTLIPLGPGIVALGNGDTFTLSQSLLTAFDTTIAGLSSAAVVTVISTIRKTWYTNYMSILEALMSCVLEVTKVGRS